MASGHTEPGRSAELDANVSHHGDWVVAVGMSVSKGNTAQIGVDVMTTDEIPGGGTVEELLESMKDLVCFVEAVAA